jgi:sec-independent protein translocase protein TatC
MNRAAATPSKNQFDPDSYRMTIGEHLEELRMRLILGLGGFIIAAIILLIFGTHVVRAFLRPLFVALERAHQNPEVYYTGVEESFVVFVKISLISAAAIASPWMLYQFWQFVAAGLYPHERKYVTKYLPLSITLLIAGMAFLYWVVLPLMLTFFLEFNYGSADLLRPSRVDPTPTSQPAYVVRQFDGDPENPLPGELYFDHVQRRFKLFIDGETRVIPFLSAGLATPLIKLDTYIDMVVKMLLAFGLSFQTPLVVMALVRMGIVEVDQLRKMRRVVYFAVTVIAAFIVPDVMTGMIALMIPLALLFEFGLWLASRQPKANP